MSTGSKPRARKPRVEEVIPGAARVVESLRDIGYELPQAVADLVDNSISAGAKNVDVDLFFDGMDSWIRVADDGVGMDTGTLVEALRYGSERDYGSDDLGKFGLGLKTASTSQCRRVVVASRKALERARVEVRTLDLDHIEETNRWEVLVVDPADRPPHLLDPLREHTGTVVLWEDLDRILDYKDPWGNWARKKLLDAAELIAEHLGMVFHRFLAGQVRGQRLKLRVNGSTVEPWDPFCTQERSTFALEAQDVKIASSNGAAIVRVRPYVLPAQSDFSSSAAWQRASGPLKWNRQQGFYIYRSNRLIQWGGWSRMRALDEHNKLARVAIDFGPELDAAFGINISKAIVRLPTDLREAIEPAMAQVVQIAQKRYREGNAGSAPRPAGARAGADTPIIAPRLAPPAGSTGVPRPSAGAEFAPMTDAGSSPLVARMPRERVAIEAAAAAAGEQDALERIVASLRRTAPEVASELGW